MEGTSQKLEELEQEAAMIAETLHVQPEERAFLMTITNIKAPHFINLMPADFNQFLLTLIESNIDIIIIHNKIGMELPQIKPHLTTHTLFNKNTYDCFNFKSEDAICFVRKAGLRSKLLHVELETCPETKRSYLYIKDNYNDITLCTIMVQNWVIETYDAAKKNLAQYVEEIIMLLHPFREKLVFLMLDTGISYVLDEALIDPEFVPKNLKGIMLSVKSRLAAEEIFILRDRVSMSAKDRDESHFMLCNRITLENLNPATADFTFLRDAKKIIKYSITECKFMLPENPTVSNTE